MDIDSNYDTSGDKKENILDQTEAVNTPIIEKVSIDIDKPIDIPTTDLSENKNENTNDPTAITVEKITTTKTVDSSSDEEDDGNDSDKENDGSSSSSSSDDDGGGESAKNKKKKQKNDTIDDDFKDKLRKSGDIIAMNDIDKGKDSESEEESDSNDSEDEDENDQDLDDDDDDQDTKALKQQIKRDKSLRQSTRIIQKIQKQQQRDKAYEHLKKLSSKPQNTIKNDLMQKNFNMNDVMNIMNEAYGSDSNDSSDSDYDIEKDKKQKPQKSDPSSSLPYDEYKKQLLADLQKNYKKEHRQNHQGEDSSDSHDDDDDDDSDEEHKSKDKTKREMMRFKSGQQSSSSSSSSSEDEDENLEGRNRKNRSKSTDPEKILFQSAAKSVGSKSAGGNKNESLQLKDRSLIQKFKAKFGSSSLSDYTKKIDFKGNDASINSLGNSYADLKEAVDHEYEGLDFDLEDDDDEEMMYRHEMEDDDDEDEDMPEDDDDALFMNDHLYTSNSSSNSSAYDNNSNSYSLSSRYDSGSTSLNSNSLRSAYSRNLGPSSHNNNNNNNQQNLKPYDITLQNLDEYVSYFGQCNVSGGQAIRRMINIKVKDRNFKFIEDIGIMLDALDQKYQQEQELMKQQEQAIQAQQQEEKGEYQKSDIKKLFEQQQQLAQQYTLPLRSLSSFDIKDEDSLTLYRLKRIALIYRHLLNVDEFSTHILEASLSNRFYQQVFKALEYHNDYADSKPYEYIKSAQFKSIIEFENPMQQKRINTLFRASYLKETLFGKEDATKTTVLTRLMLENSLEILKNVLNDHNLLKKIFEKAEKIDTKLEDLYNISKFIFELINRCKPIQGQLSGDYRKSIIPESLIKKVNTLIFVKFVFKNDLRVQKQAKILGLLFTPRELNKKSKNNQSQTSLQQESDQLNSSQNLSLDNMSSISQATLENFNEKVNSQQAQTLDIEQKLLESLKQKDDQEQLFKESNNALEQEQKEINSQKEQEFDSEQAEMYDHMIVTLLDYVYYLQTICHKEVITYFLQDIEISQILSQHLFITQNDGIRLQIIEIFKQLIDGAQSENQQQQIERLLKNTLLNAFTKIILSQNVNDFAWPVQYVFEFIQYICKPNLQQIQQMGVQLGSFEHRRERKINTFVLRNYIFEEDLIQITLNLISNGSTNQYVRLMGVKFLKSLINSQDLNFFQKMNKSEVMQAMIKALDKTKEKTKPIYNMLESTIFEFINMFTLKISEREPIRENFTAFIHEYQKELSWNKGLFKIFFDEGIQQKALNLGRTRASTTHSTHSSQAIVNSVLARYNPSLRRRLNLGSQQQHQQVKLAVQQALQQEQESNTKQTSQEKQQQEVTQELNRGQLSFADLILRELGPEGQQRIQQSLLGKHPRNEDNSEEEKEDDTVNLESLLMERKRQRTEQNYFRFKTNSIGNGEKLPIQPQLGKKGSQQQQQNVQSQETETFTWDDEDDEPMQFKPLDQISQQQQIPDVKTESDNENQKEQSLITSNQSNISQNAPSYIQIDQFMTDDNNTNYNSIINDKINIRDEFLFDVNDQFQDNDCGFFLDQSDDIFSHQKQDDSMEVVMDDHMLQQLSYQQAYINNTSDNMQSDQQMPHLNNENAFGQINQEIKNQNQQEQNISVIKDNTS